MSSRDHGTERTADSSLGVQNGWRLGSLVRVQRKEVSGTLTECGALVSLGGGDDAVTLTAR